MNLAFRPIQTADRDFLYQVYASTRTAELAQVIDWSTQQKEDFLTMQFEAQHKFYQEQYIGAEFNIILLDGHPIGRLYTHVRDDEIRIVDIALLPTFRRKGIGSTLLQQIHNQAQQAALVVRIHVELFNPALELYKRLGYCIIGENGVYYLMEWVPEDRKSTLNSEPHSGVAK